MITIEETGNLISATIYGEFTLADYREFEEQVVYKSRFEGQLNLLLDWRAMLDYTVDVAWEDIRFMREHGSAFDRIAIITDDQWQAWGAWVSNLFMNASVRVFSDYDSANAWVTDR